MTIPVLITVLKVCSLILLHFLLGMITAYIYYYRAEDEKEKPEEALMILLICFGYLSFFGLVLRLVYSIPVVNYVFIHFFELLGKVFIEVPGSMLLNLLRRNTRSNKKRESK